MSFEQYWQMLCSGDSELNDESVTMRISVALFKKELKEAFMRGYHEASGMRKAAEDFENVGKSSISSGFENMFGHLF